MTGKGDFYVYHQRLQGSSCAFFGTPSVDAPRHLLFHKDAGRKRVLFL